MPIVHIIRTVGDIEFLLNDQYGLPYPSFSLLRVDDAVIQPDLT